MEVGVWGQGQQGNCRGHWMSQLCSYDSGQWMTQLSSQPKSPSGRSLGSQDLWLLYGDTDSASSQLNQWGSWKGSHRRRQ